MEDEGFIKITDKSALEKLRAFDTYFHLQVDLLKELAKRSFEDKSKNRVNEIFPLLVGLISASTSLCFLLRKELLTEAFIISRAFMERLINACYLIICDRSQFDDYIHFSMQKVQRSMHTKKKVLDILGHVHPAIDYSEIPIVAEGLKKFTSRKGKEITRWTSQRLDKRIEAVGDRVEHFHTPLFMILYHYVYEDASEAIHGTLYGCLFHTGLFLGLGDRQYSDEFCTSTKTMLYFAAGLLIEGLLYTAAKEMDVQDLIDRSKNNNNTRRQYAGPQTNP